MNCLSRSSVAFFIPCESKVQINIDKNESGWLSLNDGIRGCLFVTGRPIVARRNGR